VSAAQLARTALAHERAGRWSAARETWASIPQSAGRTKRRVDDRTVVDRIVRASRPREASAEARGDVLAAWRRELGMSLRIGANVLGIDKETLRRFESAGADDVNGGSK
jgi:hypothetical protein